MTRACLIGAALAVVAAAGCSPPPDRTLPGASLSASLPTGSRAQLARAHDRGLACGVDIALDGHVQPDLAYRYLHDPRDRLVRATGTYRAGGSDDIIVYTYDHLDHLTHSLETRAWGDTRIEITADYDTLGDLVVYTSEQTSPTAHDVTRYELSELTPTGQPTVEVISSLGQPPARYQLAYDLTGRLAFAARDGGATTTYRYDDDARTTTIDTGNGAFHGVIAFDDRNHELSESWSGSDPAAVTSESTYTYDGDRLLGVAFVQAGASELDTLRYDCASSSSSWSGAASR